MILDFHTHRPDATDAIINIEPREASLSPTLLYSVGIHPWHSADVDAATLERLDEMAALPNVVAIGETGIDRLRGADLDTQQRLLRHHIALSERLAKPVVLHVVRGYDVVSRLKKELRPTQPWVIHGYRGNPSLTRQLLREGFYLSIGERFNAESLALIPPSHLLLETDESTLPISEIASRAGVAPVDAAALLGIKV